MLTTLPQCLQHCLAERALEVYRAGSFLQAFPLVFPFRSVQRERGKGASPSPRFQSPPEFRGRPHASWMFPHL